MPNERRARQKEAHRQRQAAIRKAQIQAQRRRTFGAIAILAVLVVGLALAVSLTGGDDDNDVETGDATSTTEAADDPAATEPGQATEESLGPDGDDGAGPYQYGEGECPAADGAERVVDFEAAPKQCIDPARSYTAVFATTEGSVKVQLDTERTPGTTNNFVTLSRFKYYDDTSLFRTEKGTGIIQGGSPHTDDNSDPGPGYPLFDEGGPFLPGEGGELIGPFQDYAPGTLAMARSQGPDSAGGQFFFVARDAQYLSEQGTYVVFGKVTEGLDVLEKIADLDDGNGAPTTPVKIESVTIEES